MPEKWRVGIEKVLKGGQRVAGPKFRGESKHGAFQCGANTRQILQRERFYAYIYDLREK